MPELPEVEVTRRLIAPLLIGRRIRAVHTTRPSYFFLTPPAQLRRALVGRTVGALERHGKYLLASLDDASRLLLHLGMTGQLFSSVVSSPRLLSSTARASLTPEAQRGFVPDAHTHLRLELDGGGPDVVFRDVRKFGKVLLLAPGSSDPRLDKLGPDALAVTAEQLARAARRRAGPVKSFLLDQAVLAGVGNIYADEALFLAGVRPLRGANRVRPGEWARLADSVRKVLERSIETGGSSISDYIRPDGADGGYQDERRVYGREGEPCSACGARIVRVVIATRSSCYCPRCQR
ncbi:MAG: bifunctional DNA-formamidopyrimidine glycosylase/DNA-(apurinic or apyrimidinic site) lyase [Polyangiaceae bacterium]|nr:bifunctional DNA-formamidopyrimidine glycosylase/DNA-(apurinic or apyrimidinic site) lyase [Polyangiaceae bacterium]MBK8939555.1 bifunctional DNA-formamidopyrimidine glycosylase/DNA-(apurinic or apyrimidinic site) lyase [Polyangiaceae bacterium]